MVQQYADRDPSASEGLTMLGNAVATGNLQDAEAVITGIMARPTGFLGRAFELARLHAAICDAYIKILALCNELINTQGASEADIAWAKAKRAEAIAALDKQGCSLTLA